VLFVSTHLPTYTASHSKKLPFIQPWELKNVTYTKLTQNNIMYTAEIYINTKLHNLHNVYCTIEHINKPFTWNIWSSQSSRMCWESNSWVRKERRAITFRVKQSTKLNATLPFERSETARPTQYHVHEHLDLHFPLDLRSPGIESRWGRDFPHPSRPAQVPSQPPTKWVTGLFPAGKAAGAWRWPPTPI
jgi:hypothetical protein